MSDDDNVKVLPNLGSQLNDMAKACSVRGGSEGHIRIEAPNPKHPDVWWVDAHGFFKQPVHGYGPTLEKAVERLHTFGNELKRGPV